MAEKTPLKWKFQTGDSIYSSPAVVDGVVYFGSRDKHLYAVDTKTGEEKWKFKTGSSIWSSPAVSDGVVYFGSSDSYLYALDAKTGEENWKFKTGGGVSSSPAVVDGVVYFGSGDKHLYALDIKTGEENWKFKTGDQVNSSPAVVDGVVYFGSYDKYLYAVDIENGEEQWKFQTGDSVYSPAVSDGVVYFGSRDNHLYAVDINTGEEKWKFMTGGWVFSPSSVSEGALYVGSTDKHLYAVDIKTGKEKWNWKRGDNIALSGLPIAFASGMVYFGSDDNYGESGHLYAVDAKTGKVKWLYKTGGKILSSPSVSGGIVYFGSYDNHLYAVDIEATLASGKEELKREEAEKEALAEAQEKADKHGITVYDIRIKYISDEITLEEAIELQTQHLKEEQKQKELEQDILLAAMLKRKEVEKKRKEVEKKRKEEEKKRQEEADKHGIPEEDIRNQYISGEITLEEAIELQKEEEELEQKRKEEGIEKLLKRDLLYACWDADPASDIYNQSYETEVTHEQADYIENQGLGCQRLEEVDPDADDYDPEETEKIKIDVEDYVDNDFKNDFFSRFDTDELESGEISKEEIEEWINSSVGRLCELFRSFTIHDEDQIYLQVESKEYKLEDLSPDWTDDKYYLDDKKMEYFINTSMEDW